MADEIERKFLVSNSEWQSNIAEELHIKQGYIAVNKRCAIRIRIANTQATFNIKSAGLDIARKEYEYPIPIDDAEEMLAQFCPDQYIEKTRYRVDHETGIWEVDVFEGLNKGLVVAEIELKSRDQNITLPDWVGTEVSGDAKYLNNNLVTKPFRTWAAAEREH
ncbi:MAG: CYTH domain-containing protein [Arenicellales bacterium]|nr:CYTH domain-containing protein [Arenicellales bacterium]